MAIKQLLIAGNAIVDILTRIDEKFLKDHKLNKGAMHLVDLVQWKKIYEKVGQTVEMSGGSGANSAAAFASLGGKAAFVGNVVDDGFGKIFRHDLKALHVDFVGKKKETQDENLETGRSLILTSSDSERSMVTYLGAAQDMHKDDLSPALLENSGLFYIEGYLWDSNSARVALNKAILYANKAGIPVALSLADSYCVERHKNDFRQLIQEHKIQIVFANGSELAALYSELATQDGLILRQELQKSIDFFACITDGKKGSYLITQEGIEHINPHPEKKKVIDTTGAGDLYAAGVLYGYCHNFSLRESAALGSFCGSLIVQQMGTRYLGSLKIEARKNGFPL